MLQGRILFSVLSNQKVTKSKVRRNYLCIIKSCRLVYKPGEKIYIYTHESHFSYTFAHLEPKMCLDFEITGCVVSFVYLSMTF